MELSQDELHIRVECLHHVQTMMKAYRSCHERRISLQPWKSWTISVIRLPRATVSNLRWCRQFLFTLYYLACKHDLSASLSVGFNGEGEAQTGLWSLYFMCICWWELRWNKYTVGKVMIIRSLKLLQLPISNDNLSSMWLLLFTLTNLNHAPFWAQPN